MSHPRAESSKESFFSRQFRLAFENKKSKNARYSLRAFASFLDLPLSTVINLLEEKTSPSARTLKQISQKLAWPSDIAILVRSEQAVEKARRSEASSDFLNPSDPSLQSSLKALIAWHLSKKSEEVEFVHEGRREIVKSESQSQTDKRRSSKLILENSRLIEELIHFLASSKQAEILSDTAGAVSFIGRDYESKSLLERFKAHARKISTLAQVRDSELYCIATLVIPLENGRSGP